MNGQVKSAARTLAIFEAFAEGRGALQLREIASICKMPVSTCHGLVQTLLERGYLYTLGQRREIYPNRRLLTLATTIDERDPFLSRMAPVLEKLRDDFGETVTVAKRHGDRVLYLNALEGSRAIRYAARAGEFRAMHSTALGKAMLSCLEPAQLRAWLKGRSLPRVTAKTVCSAAELTRQLETGRQRGYFMAIGEQAEDLTAIAVPVMRHGEPLAVSLTGPSARMKSELKRYAGRLLQVRHGLEVALRG